MRFCFILEQSDMLLLSVIYHADCEHAISFCSAMLFVSMLWNSAMEQNMSLVIFLLPCFGTLQAVKRILEFGLLSM